MTNQQSYLIARDHIDELIAAAERRRLAHQVRGSRGRVSRLIGRRLLGAIGRRAGETRSPGSGCATVTEES